MKFYYFLNKSLLQFAVENEYIDIVKLLLNYEKININYHGIYILY